MDKDYTMDKTHKIIMIFASGCDQCKSMKEAIYSIAKFEKISVEIEAHNCEDDGSIDVAMDSGISDVPGCKIGEIVIEGEDYSRKEIEIAIKNLV